MARDILSEYGKDSSQPQAARATSGGVKEAKPISNYKPPQGPSNINDPKNPGLHGDYLGSCPKPGGVGSSGSPGLGGTVHRSGSQRG